MKDLQSLLWAIVHLLNVTFSICNNLGTVRTVKACLRLKFQINEKYIIHDREIDVMRCSGIPF